MPRLNIQKYSADQLKRSIKFKGKLLEHRMRPIDAANELDLSAASISKYGYGLLREKSRIEKWAIEKFGREFVEELNQLIA